MTTVPTSALRDAALSYAARGWCVLPLHDVTAGHCSCAKGATCDKPGKHPHIDHWPETASCDPAQIRDWWEAWPTANVGILTGHRSRLAVLDVDPRHGGDIALADLEACYTPLPETTMVLSGGADQGQHRYFALDGPLGKFDPAPGLNLQADGAYVVAPPSLHASGRLYTWEASSEPDDVPLAPLPDWLTALAHDRAAAEAATVTIPDELPAVDVTTLQVSTRIKFLICTGTDPHNRQRYPSRSEVLFAVTTELIRAGYDDATIASIALDRRYPISEKVWSQKNPKSPTYASQTRQWLAGDIGRARAYVARHPTDQETPAPPDSPDDPADMEDLLRHAQADAAQRGNGHRAGPEPTDPYACPELPATAKVDDERAAEASPFLDEYIAFSHKWAPRAYGGFHEAAGLFTLSTTAAHRVRIEFGPHGVYTSLYMALAARTSMFTKTTCVDIALALLRLAGMQTLLADDDATPAAFLRSLTLYIPPEYGALPSKAQEAIRDRLAFAGQKGWFYEEWGQHLHAMMAKEGQMAAFRSIVRRLDDHKDEYVYSTISRGRDVLIKPYVALLANVTPADLRPFLRAQSSLWRDGYIARFAFIAPGECPASTAAFPEETMTIPPPLITRLASWHKRLGIPHVSVDPLIDEQGKATGRYQPIFLQPHIETPYVLSPEVRTAFYAYDTALHTLMAQSKNEDLDGSYARFPMKALRIAGLLASLHDDSDRHTIGLAQWSRGQQIAERWRRDLHTLIKQVSGDEPTSHESRKEHRIVEVLRHNAALSLRDLHLKTKLAYGDIAQTLSPLIHAGVIREEKTPRTTKYGYVLHDDNEP
jgi:hypothetical protein